MVMQWRVLASLLLCGAALASPTYETGVDVGAAAGGLLEREEQLLSIVEGGRQLYLLLSEALQLGQTQARALTADLSVQSVARAVHNSDPVEAALNAIDLDSTVCRQRAVCQLQTLFEGRLFGDMAYEMLVRGVPALRKYGYRSARQLGADTCGEAFQCPISNSPYMEQARQMRALADDFCDLEGDSVTSRVCRALVYAVDYLETL